MTITKALEGGRDFYSSNGHSDYGHDPVIETDGNWGTRLDLTPNASAPSLPEAMVPVAFREWLVGSAQIACIPLAMFAAPTVTALGSLIGRKVGIQPSPYDSFITVPNFWGANIPPPASLKSSVQEEATYPLRRLAATARDRHQAALATDASAVIRVKAEIDGLKQLMTAVSKGTNKDHSIADLEAELTKKMQEQQDLETTLVERRYLTHDATTVKLGELLRENPNGLLVVRDELSGWLRMMDRSGREGDREFYLEAWNGTGEYFQDRIGRGTVHISSMCLSVFGGIQPGKLQSYIKDAIDGGAGDDGLLQRIQLTVWPDTLGKWVAPTARMDDTA